MQRPSIDRNRRYRKVRKSDVQVSDAIAPNDPQPGDPYYRVTDIKHQGTRLRPTKVFGYYVGTKKKEDSGRPSKDITDIWKTGNPFLLERIESGSEEAVKPEPVEVPEKLPELPKNDDPKLQISIIKNDGELTVTVAQPGQDLLTARGDHPNFARIWDKIARNDDEGLADLFNITKSVEIKFKRLSERVAVRQGNILLDGDPVDNSLTKQVIRFIDEGREDWAPLVAFFEKVQANPSDHSRTQLYSFLDHNDLELTAQGDLIAYKSVNRDGLSRNAGHAFVDGVEHNGRIPNEPGSIIEIPRSEVADDPANACSVGLHVATEGFARTFADGPLYKLLVSPRDVVSVPHNEAAQKVRVCRYKVLEEVQRS